MTDDFDDLLEANADSDAMTADQLGELLGISGRVVRELAQRGIIRKAGRGTYPVRPSVKAYCAHLREQAAGRAGATSLTAERQRVAKEQADKLALANAVARGEMVSAKSVEAGWASILRDVRAAMLAVPSRCGSNLSHLTSHDVGEIDREIRAALEALADDN